MTKKLFKRKPETLEAIQWTGDNLQDILDFCGHHPEFPGWFTSDEEYIQYVKDHESIIRIYNPGGEDFWYKPGVWLFKDESGVIKEISKEELEASWVEVTE